MFAYNPSVNDRSGEILGAYTASAANTRAEGMQQMGQSIGQGLAGLGGSIGGMVQKKQEDAAKATSIGEALNTMQTVLPTYGPEGAALADALMQDIGSVGNNTDKMAGRWMAAQPIISNFMSRYNQQASIEGYKDLADYKAANAPASTTTAPRMNSESIRSMVAEAKAAGFTDDAIKAKLQSQFGDWAVRSVYPPQNQGIWMGQ